MTIQYKHKSFYSTHLLKKIMGIKDCFVNKMLARWEKSDRIRLAGMNLPFEIEEKRDIPYMSDSSRINRNMLQAVFIDIYGGGFMSGCKELNRPFGCYITQQGFLVFNLNYRLAVSKVKIPDQIRDIAAAIDTIYPITAEMNAPYTSVVILPALPLQ